MEMEMGQRSARFVLFGCLGQLSISCRGRTGLGIGFTGGLIRDSEAEKPEVFQDLEDIDWVLIVLPFLYHYKRMPCMTTSEVRVPARTCM